MRVGDEVLVTYHSTTGRMFRWAKYVKCTSLGDVIVQYGNEIQIVCDPKYVHPRRRNGLGKSCIPNG